MVKHGPGKREPYQAAVAYGRYSCSHQNEHSADDQNRESEQWVRAQVGADVPFFAYSDEAVPGAVVERDGLDEALGKTREFGYGVFIVESISRLGRSIKVCVDVIFDLHDRGWRFVSRKDGVDTETPLWPGMVAMMSSFAETENQQKAEMVRRGRRNAFARGQGVGNIPLHYKKVPMDSDDPDSPLMDVIREEFKANIQEYFARIAAGQTIPEVNRWANTLPDKLGRAEGWELDDGIRMLTNTRYMGRVQDGKTVRVLIRSTGHRIQVPNEGEDIRQRLDPNQAFVSQELWQAANDAIARRRHPSGPRKIRHPREGKNRSRGMWPSGALYCGWCGSKLHRSRGPGSTRYVCSGADAEAPICANHLSAETADIAQRIWDAVLEEVMKQEGLLAVLCEEVARQCKILQDADPAAAEKHRSDLSRAEQQLSRLLRTVRDGVRDDDPAWKMISEKRADIERINQHLAAAGSQAPRYEAPTPEAMKQALLKTKDLFETCPEEFLAWMRVLVPQITLHPVQIKGLTRYLLEAHFPLCLINLLPSEWLVFMRKRTAHIENVEVRDMLVRDMRLIVTPIPRYGIIAPQVKRMVDSGITLKAVAREFSCDLGVIHRAIRVMRQQEGDELQIIPVQSLPNLRRKRRNAPERAALSAENDCPVPKEAMERILPKVLELRAKGYKPKGIAEEMGCRTSTIEKCLKWSDSISSNSPQEGSAA